MPAMLLLVQNWIKWPICPNNRDLLWNIIYTTIFCNDTPLSWTISNLKSWSRSLEGMKQFRRSYIYRYINLPQTSNQVWLALTMMKKNSEYTFIFPKIPIKALFDDVKHEHCWSIVLTCCDCWLKVFLPLIPVTFFWVQSNEGFFQN